MLRLNDGEKKAKDAKYWLQRFTPRRARSMWSKVNRARAEALIAAGRMQESGQAEIDRAKADGRWDAACDSARTAAVPADLQAALDAHPKARAFFSTLNARCDARARRQDPSVITGSGASRAQPGGCHPGLDPGSTRRLFARCMDCGSSPQ